MAAACTIIIDRLDEGRYRATCTVFPELEVIADTEEAARAGMEAAIGRLLRRRLNAEELPADESVL
ncbi:MAG TPA: hypothetical protein VNK04_24090 [Gemmataceae bacterium]|nr:hypothetical protein [Gemmataceae bacterium]